MKQAQRSVNYVSSDFVWLRIAALLRGVIVTGGMQNHKGDFARIAGMSKFNV
jgi:hypothetical protein